MKLELNKKQLENLATMLNRVQLTGAEVPAWIEIVNAIQNAIKEKQYGSKHKRK